MNSSNQSMVTITIEIPFEMEYVKYLNLGIDIIITLCHVTTILFTFHLIYCSKFDKKSTKLDRISNSFLINLGSRGFGAVLATPYYVYLSVYWSSAGGRNYSPYALLWLGLGTLIHAYLSTLSALLLTLERCLALTFPMHYNSQIVKWFPRLTLTCFILWSIIIIFYVLGEIPLDVENVHNCQLASCVLRKYRFMIPQYARFGIGGLNVLGSCYLICAVKWNSSEKLKNDVVKFTITMDIFLDVIPTFSSFMLLVTIGFAPAFYIGQSAYFLAYLNVAVCSIYYWWRLTRKTNGFRTKVSKIERVPGTITAT